MKRRSVKWLTVSWVGYWLALAVVKLGPAAAAIWHASRGPGDANQNNVTFSAGNEGLKLLVSEHGVTTWTGSVSLLALAAWIAAVPLALWFAWFIAARSDVPGAQAPKSESRISV